MMTGKNKGMPALLQYLIEEQADLRIKIAQAEAEQRMGQAVYLRTMAAHDAILYGWLTGDDTQQVLAHKEKEELRHDITRVDEENLQYRIALAQTKVAA